MWVGGKLRKKEERGRKEGLLPVVWGLRKVAPDLDLSFKRS